MTMDEHRTATRLDVSAVPYQGGYIAKQCPVVIQNRILFPEREDKSRSPEAEARIAAGVEFEARLVETLRVEAADGDWYVIPDVDRDEAQRLTAAAMAEGVPVIEQGYLPADHDGRRTGRPDLVVFHAGGYVPVDIKHHRVLDMSDESVLVSDPLRPSPEDRFPMEGFSLRARKDDALQLAHYRRMLEAVGHASESTLAGILGVEEVVVWYDLSEPMWTTPAKSEGKKQKKRTTLECYDFEFGFRLDIAAAAIAHRTDPQIGLLVEPMSSGECGDCGFRQLCDETLLGGTGDASLLPNTSYLQWRTLRDHELTEREDVARLHHPTAELASRGVEVAEYLGLASDWSRSTPVEALRPRAHKQIRLLGEVGIDTVGDLLDRVDPLTASIGGWVAARIIDARAAVGHEPVYRRPGMSGADLARADVEVDVDMENVAEGVYLWGTLLTDCSGSGRFQEGYSPFFTWAPLDPTVEADLFVDFWKWLSEQRRIAAELGLTFGVYVYTGAEESNMRRIARAVPSLDEEVSSLVRSDEWVDLKQVFDRSWITGHGTGLKAVAPLAGYTWPVDDPGGDYSMLVYAEAVSDDTERHDPVRRWVLDYNRGDVEATKQIREWLSDEGEAWPQVRAG